MQKKQLCSVENHKGLSIRFFKTYLTAANVVMYEHQDLA